MPILVEKVYFPQFLRDNPHDLFVFGDNLMRTGTGGQAVIRHEPNSIGVPTKVGPYHFMSDKDYARNTHAIANALNQIEGHLRTGRKVYFPYNGLGTGRAKLAQVAPKTFAFLLYELTRMFKEYAAPGVDIPISMLYPGDERPY